MAAKGNTCSTNILKLVYTATAWTSVADNAGTSPLTNIYVALHSASPGATGDQTTNEIAYTSYARVAVARSTSGWTVGTATMSPAATISFPAGTGGSGTASYASTGSASSGADTMFHFGAISPSIVTGSGVTPQLTTSSAITES